MELKITLKTYYEIKKEVEKEISNFGYDYFNNTLRALDRCINKSREYKHLLTEIKVERRTLTKIVLFIDGEKHLLKLTSKMKNILFPKERKKVKKIYVEPKDTSSLFVQ